MSSKEWPERINSFEIEECKKHDMSSGLELAGVCVSKKGVEKKSYLILKPGPLPNFGMDKPDGGTSTRQRFSVRQKLAKPIHNIKILKTKGV